MGFSNTPSILGGRDSLGMFNTFLEEEKEKWGKKKRLKEKIKSNKNFVPMATIEFSLSFLITISILTST